MGVTIFSNQRVTDYQLRDNLNALSTYIAVNKINLKKQDAYATNEVETGEDNVNTILFRATSNLQASTYNDSALFANSGFAWFDATLDCIYAGITYDNYSDGSVDATKWTITSGTGSETANTSVNSSNTGTTNNATIDSKGSSVVDLKPSGTNTEVIVRIAMANDGSTNNCLKQSFLYLRDGSGNQATLVTGYNADNTSAQSYTATLRILLTTTNARIYTDKDTYTDVDISALVGTGWYFRLVAQMTEADASPRGATVNFFPLIYVNNSTVSAQTIESVRTASNNSITVSKGFIHTDFMSDGSGTSTAAISADNGSNFTTSGYDTWTTIANTGSTVSVKHTLQGTGREKLIKIDSQCLLYSG